jgi:hypothetical protein
MASLAYVADRDDAQVAAWKPIPCRAYRKPPEICRCFPAWEGLAEPRDVARFSARRRRVLEWRILALGFRLRRARLEDLPALHKLELECFRPPVPERTINAYELYRILQFGHPVVLERPDGEIVGFDLAEDFDGPQKTAGSAGYTVHPGIAGRRLGSMMLTWSLLRAMAAGATTRRGIVNPRNLASLSVLLNTVGGVCDGFFPRFADWGEPRFTHCTPLTPGGLTNNRIDPRRAAAFLAAGREGVDYRTVDCQDYEALGPMYGESPFRVIALLKTGPRPRFLAIPRSRLGFPATAP